MENSQTVNIDLVMTNEEFAILQKCALDNNRTMSNEIAERMKSSISITDQIVQTMKCECVPELELMVSDTVKHANEVLKNQVLDQVNISNKRLIQEHETVIEEYHQKLDSTLEIQKEIVATLSAINSVVPSLQAVVNSVETMSVQFANQIAIDSQALTSTVAIINTFDSKMNEVYEKSRDRWKSFECDMDSDVGHAIKKVEEKAFYQLKRVIKQLRPFRYQLSFTWIQLVIILTIMWIVFGDKIQQVFSYEMVLYPIVFIVLLTLGFKLFEDKNT